MNQNQRYKLRKIIARNISGADLLDCGLSSDKYKYLGRYESLECGHIQMEKFDIYGPTNAYKRRCRRCLKDGPAN